MSRDKLAAIRVHLGRTPNKTRLTLVAVLIFFTSTSGYAFGRYQHRLKPQHISQVRERAILSQAAQSKFQTIVIGDGIVELAYLPSLCGKSTLNAGVGGARVGDLSGLLQKALRVQQPTRVIILAGVNDATKKSPTSVAAFSHDLDRLIEIAAASGAEVDVATIAPVRTDMPIGAVFDPVLISRFNAVIASKAAVIPMNADLTRPGALPTGWTDDGVHLTPAGYAVWTSALEGRCGRQAPL